MGWNFRWLVNVALLAPPIAITLAVLFSVEKYREDKGQPPIWNDPEGPDVTPNDNGIQRKQYCQESFGIHPDTKGLEFTCKSDLPRSHDEQPTALSPVEP